MFKNASQKTSIRVLIRKRIVHEYLTVINQVCHSVFYIQVIGITFFPDVWIEGPNCVHEKQTVQFKGNVRFSSSIKYLKWQKYQNGVYVDIIIHKSKYAGSSNGLQNPKLVIHDIDAEDEVDYRLKVQLRKSTIYSNVFSFNVTSLSGKITLPTT